MLTILISCSVNSSKQITYKILNESIINHGIVELQIVNNSKQNENLPIENSFYFKNYLCLSGKDLILNRIYITDEEDSLVQTIASTYNLKKQSNEGNYKVEDSISYDLIKFAKNNSIIRFPYLNLVEKNLTEYSYRFKKNKKYYFRIEFVPNNEISELYLKKGIKIYNKRITSNKVTIFLNN